MFARLLLSEAEAADEMDYLLAEKLRQSPVVNQWLKDQAAQAIARVSGYTIAELREAARMLE